MHYIYITRNSLTTDKLHDTFRGQSRSPNMVPFHMLGAVSYKVSYSNSVHKMHHFDRVPAPEVLKIQSFSTPLHSIIQGPSSSRSFYIIQPYWYIGYGFLLMFCSNFVPKMHCFWDIRLQKCRDLENQVRGPSRSLKMSPFDRVHRTSYWRSIANMDLSLFVSEIFNVERYRNIEIMVRGQKVIEIGTIWYTGYGIYLDTSETCLHHKSSWKYSISWSASV